MRTVLIRAPTIVETRGNARSLANPEGATVFAQHGNMLATTLHPELSNSTAIHRYLLRMAEGLSRAKATLFSACGSLNKMRTVSEGMEDLENYGKMSKKLLALVKRGEHDRGQSEASRNSCRLR